MYYNSVFFLISRVMAVAQYAKTSDSTTMLRVRFPPLHLNTVQMKIENPVRAP